MLTIPSESQYNHQFKRWGLSKRKRKEFLGFEEDSPASSSSQSGSFSPFTPPSSADTILEAQRNEQMIHRKRLKTVASFTVASMSPLQGSDTEQAGNPAEIRLSTEERLSGYLLDTIEEDPGASPLGKPAPSTISLPENMAGEILDAGNFRFPIPTEYISVPSGLDYQQDWADFFFNLGDYEAAFPCFENVWMQFEDSQSGYERFLAAAWCIRSATTPLQLYTVIAKSPELERAHQIIQRAETSDLINLDVDNITDFLNAMLVLEAQSRVDSIARPDHLIVRKDPQVIRNLLTQLPQESRPVQFLAYYFLNKSELSELYQLWSSTPLAPRRLHTRGEIGSGSLDVKTSDWDRELKRWLSWCQTQLQRVTLHCSDARLLESCEVKDDLWILETVLYCLLWDAYESRHRRSNFGSLGGKMGFSPGQLFRVVAALITERVSASLFVTPDALPHTRDSNHFISRSAIECANILQLPHQNLAHKFLEKLTHEGPLSPMKGNMNGTKIPPMRRSLNVSVNTLDLAKALRSPKTSPSRGQRSSSTVSEDDVSMESDYEDELEDIAQEGELSSVLVDNGNRCILKGPIQAFIPEDLESTFRTQYKGQAEIQQYERATVMASGVRNSAVSQGSRGSWTKSLRSSDHSFAAFKASGDSTKQDCGSSRSSADTRDSFLSFLEQMKRLSDKLGVFGFAPEEQDEEHYS